MTILDEILIPDHESHSHGISCECSACASLSHASTCRCKSCQASEFGEAESAYRRRKKRRLRRRGRRLGRGAVKRAIARGNRNEKRLTDLVFYSRHPELPKNYRLKKGQKALIREWISIRNSLVRPLLRATKIKTPSYTPSTTSTTINTTNNKSNDDDYYTSPKQYSIERLIDEAKPKPGSINRSKTPRKLAQIDAVVLHQMAFSRGTDLRKYLKVGVHYIVMSDGKIGQLHPHSTYLNASNGFNRRSVAIEFAGNFPDINGRYWKPKDKQKWMRNIVTQDQINAGRYLLAQLKKKLPNLRFVYAHRQSSWSRTNDPGPDLWRGVGEYAIRKLGYDPDSREHISGTGKAIPAGWR